MDMQKAFEQKWLIENQKSIKADVDVVLTFCESKNKYKVNSLKAMKPEAIELCELVNFDYSIWCEAWRAAKASAVPDGYCVVPKEPTEKMIDAGHDFCKNNIVTPSGFYKAMIEATQEQGHE